MNQIICLKGVLDKNVVVMDNGDSIWIPNPPQLPPQPYYFIIHHQKIIRVIPTL